MPDLTPTLDALDKLRSLHGWGMLTAALCRTTRTEAQLWRLEKYLVHRLERSGIADPAASPTDGALQELYQDTGGSN